MKGNYNYVASFYDRLSRIFFGQAIVNSQKFLIEAIQPNSTILIIGGGTGWILEEIKKQHHSGLHITYLDISPKMIALAKKRDFGSNAVLFSTCDIQLASINDAFDIVITPFLLDNFTTGTVHIVFDKIHRCLVGSGLWLFADFEINSKECLWQKPLLKIMYFFFNVVCNVEAEQLPDTNSLYDKYGYTIVASKAFFRNFIRSVIYRKPN